MYGVHQRAGFGYISQILPQRGGTGPAIATKTRSLQEPVECLSEAGAVLKFVYQAHHRHQSGLSRHWIGA